MQPPCEIMTRYFLPDVRGIVAHELNARGTSQTKIAKILGITQARVSHYLAKKRSLFYSNLEKRFGISVNELEGFATILADDACRSQIDGIFTLYSIWKNLLFNGQVCSIHQLEFSISKDCSVCMDLHRSQAFAPNETTSKHEEESYILHNISEAITSIESSSEFPQIMPEVSVNIAMCKQNPKSKRDVAAIPGRINKIHGRARAFVLPEFGSSNHMSNVLILFNSKSSRIRSVMDLRYDELMGRSLSLLEIPKIMTNGKPLHVKGHHYHRDDSHIPSNDQIVLERLASLEISHLISGLKSPFAIIDKGSEGLEPITYLFGFSATELSLLALKIADTYSRLVYSNVS
jgi:predicted fused transcriptional regulator/phosphomethylpyrimidine kinase/predicted transcriptional regulator